MNVPFACGELNREVQPVVEEFDEPMKTMVRHFVGMIYERVLALDFFHVRVIFR